MSSRRTDEVWLDDEQQRAWLQLIGMVVRLPAVLETELQQATGLAVFEYMVLSRLSEAERRTLRMSELAARVSSSPSRLSHVVSRLESRGWVARRDCAGDRRATEAFLTEDGWAVLRASAPLHVHAVRRLVIDALTPAQLRRLGALAARVTAHIEARTDGSRNPVADVCPADRGSPAGGGTTAVQEPN